MAEKEATPETAERANVGLPFDRVLPPLKKGDLYRSFGEWPTQSRVNVTEHRDDPIKVGYQAGFRAAQALFRDSDQVAGCLLGGDPDWLAAYRELRGLHLKKSATYGTQLDRLSNFTQLAEQTGRPPEYYVAERMLEKLHRALNMLSLGFGGEIEEWPDLASLALCAEALRRRG